MVRKSAASGGSCTVTENNGVYTATLSGTKGGVATVTVETDGTAVSGLPVAAVTLIQPAANDLYTQINAFSFSAQMHFPTTGFVGATFTMRIRGDSVNNSGYVWAVDRDWVSVSNGVIKMLSKPASGENKVTITATSKVNGDVQTYAFTVSDWFLGLNGSGAISWGTAKIGCETQGMTQPDIAALTRGNDTRTVGSLWSEWGALGDYNSYFGNNYVWTTDINISENTGAMSHMLVYLRNGLPVKSNSDNNTYSGICRQGF